MPPKKSHAKNYASSNGKQLYAEMYFNADGDRIVQALVNLLSNAISLSICKSIIEGRNGRIDYLATPKMGTEFFVILPIA